MTLKKKKRKSENEVTIKIIALDGNHVVIEAQGLLNNTLSPSDNPAQHMGKTIIEFVNKLVASEGIHETLH